MILLEYKNDKEFFEECKPLLLNALDSKEDKLVGDSGIQLMFRFVDFSGSSQFFLHAGGAIERLESSVGLCFFDAVSVETVLDTIILDMSLLFLEHILPWSKLESSPQLLLDIQKYIRFSLYGTIC